MRIGMFTDSYFPQVSGVATSIKLLKDQLIKNGHEVYIFTTTDPDAVEEPGIIRLKSIPFASFEDRRIAIAGFDKCMKLARQYNLDIIHTHTEFSLGLAGMYLASKLKIPIIHTYHTMYENYTHYIWNGKLIKRQHVKWYSRLFCSQTNGVITPSQMTYDTLNRYGVKKQMRIIPTGVAIPEQIDGCREDMRRQLGIPMNSPVLLSLSRLSKEKSVDEIISNFVNIQKTDPSIYLVIVGEGPQRESLEALVKGYNLNNVIFTGEIPHDQVNHYYQMADLYVNASESESQGLTYLESIANKLPVIAKYNSYLASILEYDSYGSLYAYPKTLAETTLEFLKRLNKEEITEILQEDLYNISVDKFVKEVETFYSDIISNYDGQTESIYRKVSKAAKELVSKI